MTEFAKQQRGGTNAIKMKAERGARVEHVTALVRRVTHEIHLKPAQMEARVTQRRACVLDVLSLSRNQIARGGPVREHVNTDKTLPRRCMCASRAKPETLRSPAPPPLQCSPHKTPNSVPPLISSLHPSAFGQPSSLPHLAHLFCHPRLFLSLPLSLLPHGFPFLRPPCRLRLARHPHRRIRPRSRLAMSFILQPRRMSMLTPTNSLPRFLSLCSRSPRCLSPTRLPLTLRLRLLG